MSSVLGPCSQQAEKTQFMFLSLFFFFFVRFNYMDVCLCVKTPQRPEVLGLSKAEVAGG